MRSLIWRLFPTYLLFIVVCTGATAIYSWRATHRFFISRAEQHLSLKGRLIRQQLSWSPESARQQELEARVHELAELSQCRITLIDADGTVIAESHRGPESLLNHANRPEFIEARSGGTGSAIRFSQTLDQDMLYVAMLLGGEDARGGVLRVAKPLRQINQELAGIYIALALVAGLVIVMAGLLALVVSHKLTKPLAEIRDGAQRFARGDLGHRLYVSRTEEIGALAESLNQMAGQLDEKIRAVTEQKMRQDAILASMDEGVVAVDKSARLLSLNAAAEKLLGVAEPAGSGGHTVDPVGRPFNEVVRHAQLERMVDSVLVDDQAAEAEISFRFGRHEPLVQVHAVPLRDAEGLTIGALLVFNDITRLRRLERVRQDFVANVSHELKTPITSIKGFLETLRDGPVEQDQAKRFLAIVAAQADRLHAIIDDLLTLSGLERQGERAELRFEDAPLAPILHQAADLCQLAAQKGDVKFQIDCPADLTARINGPLIEQAVSNLLDNAIKYSEPGQTVCVSAEPLNGGVMIRVRDHGCGIPAEHLPRMFERFYRVDRARSRKLGGTGLGLAIVKHIANAHGGTASAASTPGEGSTFTISLPARSHEGPG